MNAREWNRWNDRNIDYARRLLAKCNYLKVARTNKYSFRIQYKKNIRSVLVFYGRTNIDESSDNTMITLFMHYLCVSKLILLPICDYYHGGILKFRVIQTAEMINLTTLIFDISAIEIPKEFQII